MTFITNIWLIIKIIFEIIMVTNHTFCTFFFVVISINVFIRYHFEQKIPFIIDIMHHLNKREDKKDLLV